MSIGTPELERPTFVVELTPPGRAAVAAVLVCGPNATELVSRCFRTASGRELASVPLKQIVVGRWGGVHGEELVVCRRSEEQVEVQCHGGVAAVNAVMDRLIAQGCRRISWTQWLEETWDDPIRVAAQIALAEAGTARTAAILLDQYHGALTAAIQTTIGAISFGDWSGAATTLDVVLAYREVGMHLTIPWRVVLAGSTNVGKSSLINALAGFQRSIVSHQPGTTRDIVTLNTAIDGWPVQFADTAGLRDTADELESAGVNLAMASVASADLVIAVSDGRDLQDASGDLDQYAPQLVSHLDRARRVIYVMNKVDLLTRAERAYATNAFEITGVAKSHDAHRQELTLEAIPKTLSRCLTGTGRGVMKPLLFTSAMTGEGIAELVSAIGRALVPRAPSPGCGVPFSPHQLSVLDAARGAIDARDDKAAIAALQSLLSDKVPAAAGWPVTD